MTLRQTDKVSRAATGLLSALLLCPVGCSDPEPVSDIPSSSSPTLMDRGVLTPPFEHVNAVWAGVALLDFDQDGWLDIFLTNGLNAKDALYRNVGGGAFEDVAEQAGVASLLEHGSVTSGDLNNDGHPDLVVSQACSTGTFTYGGGQVLDGGKLLYLNNGDGTFGSFDLDVPDEAVDALQWCTVSLHLVDWNNDGNLDLFVAGGIDPDLTPPQIFIKNEPSARNYILLGDGTGTFSDVIWERTGVYDSNDDKTYAITFAAAFMDVNGDGRVDVLQGQGGTYLEVFPQGEDGSFGGDDPNYPDFTNTGSGLWMGLAVSDYNGDGALDLYATNQGLSTLMVGYENTSLVAEHLETNLYHSMTSFQDGILTSIDWPTTAAHELAGDLFDGFWGEHDDLMNPQGLQRYAWGWGAVPLDLDADGLMDVAFTGNNCSPPLTVIWDEARGAGPGALLLNDKGAGFVDVTWESQAANIDDQGRYQDGRGIATGDLNNDGYADLVIANRSYNPTLTDPLAQENGTPQVLLSRPRAGNWLQLDLEGTTSNRDGLGSMIHITRDDGTFTYIFGQEGGTNSSSERLLTVGLGDAEQVDVEVQFPSGTVVELTDVEANQRLSVEEDG